MENYRRNQHRAITSKVQAKQKNISFEMTCRAYRTYPQTFYIFHLLKLHAPVFLPFLARKQPSNLSATTRS